MAADTPQYVTLGAGIASTVTFTEDYQLVRVTSLDGASAVYFTADGVTVPKADTTGNFVVPAAIGAHRTVGAKPVITDPASYTDPVTKTIKVQLIAAAAVKVCVEGLADNEVNIVG